MQDDLGGCGKPLRDSHARQSCRDRPFSIRGQRLVCQRVRAGFMREASSVLMPTQIAECKAGA